ncbi:TRAP transporter small permease [Aquabacterium sp. A08]|uniref:TRAP transporter small permease n=1 Tax=Aquabacterium sp. A08 TaxID=2718532 RepID=UPI001422CF25|nr:TRAP transporter small permease [Aquabacterium sp. A08]NIC43260.1 TRAP transporter small permease [Aquabacterium sp. A08]
MSPTLDRLLKWTCGAVSALALFGIMWLMLFDVIGRKYFNQSIPGALEITEILMVVVIFGALPLVSWRGEHIVFDSLDGVVPRALKGLQHRVVHLLCAGTFAFLGLQLLKRAERFAEYGEVTAHLGLALAPVAWLMAALLGATALVHLLFVVQLPPGALEHVAHTPELPE